MAKPSLRFDHKEIAVIFSLFIFVSLLMFTVGILVGKGLAQAKYESLLLNAPVDSSHLARGNEAAPPSNDGAPPADASSQDTASPAGRSEAGKREPANEGHV